MLASTRKAVKQAEQKALKSRPMGAPDALTRARFPIHAAGHRRGASAFLDASAPRGNG
jgi:hypothetical protein